MKHLMLTKRKAGVTLTELLVVIAIITIISTILVLNFRAGEKGGKLMRSAQLLVQGIRKAQNMALGSKENLHPQTANWEVPEGGYGVYLTVTPAEDNQGQYIIFGDFFTTGADYEDKYNYPGSPTGFSYDEKIEPPIKLETGIIIEHIRYQPSNGQPSATNLNFEALYPLIKPVPPIPPADEINITLKKKEKTDSCGDDCQRGVVGSCPEGCKVVKILKAGWVSIVD